MKKIVFISIFFISLYIPNIASAGLPEAVGAWLSTYYNYLPNCTPVIATRVALKTQVPYGRWATIAGYPPSTIWAGGKNEHQTCTSSGCCWTFQAYYWTEIPDNKYCITKGWSCANGDAVALEYTMCDVEGFPSSEKSYCGNMSTADKIDAGEIDGNVFENPDCGCDLTMEEIDAMCAQIDQEKSNCDDCSTKDTDNDGVNDCDDWCPDTQEGTYVSEHGCPADDDDGDGVPNDWDQCPNTPPNMSVDQFGCPMQIDEDKDSDNDGIPDIEDNCPSQGGTVGPDGCPIDNPQSEPDPNGGDQDNDNGLLEGVIAWLKKLVGVTDDVGDKVDAVGQKVHDVGEKVDDVGDKIQEFKNAFDEFTDTEGVSTDLPEDDDFNGDLPEDFEAIDLENDFMSDFLGGLLQNNAFIQQIQGSSLNASGSCSVSGSIHVLGKSMTVNFSLCEYDLSIFRAMILMISGLTGFFIVFRKG